MNEVIEIEDDTDALERRMETMQQVRKRRLMVAAQRLREEEEPVHREKDEGHSNDA